MFKRFRRTAAFRSLFLLSLFASGLWAAAKEPFPGADDKWRRYQSAHFELFSRNSDFDSRRLLNNLELLRSLFLDNYKLVERKKLEVTVFFFANESDFENYKPAELRKNDRIGACSLSDPDRDVLVISPSPTLEAAQRLAFMGYVHHLFRITGGNPPTWFSSGVAELYATLEVEQKNLIFGRPDPDRVRELQQSTLMPLDVLLGLDHSSAIFQSGQKSSLFYAQAWALVHYWYLGKSGLSREGIDGFLKYVLKTDGVQSYDAAQTREIFRQTTGMDYQAMNDRLERYARDGRYSYSRLPLPKVAPPESYVRQPLSREEIRERLAELALRVNRSSQAKFALLTALEKAPGNFRIMEVLGSEALKDGETERASERWEQALAAGSKNPALYDLLTQFESRRWFQSFDFYYRLPDEKTRHLRELLAHSIAELPNQTEAYEMLAWVEAFAQQPSVPNLNLVQSHFDDLANKPRTLLALAFVRLRLNDRQSAKEMLDGLDKMQPDDWVANGAEITRAVLEGRPPKRLNRESRPPGWNQSFRFEPPERR